MIDETVDFFEGVAEGLEVTIRIPRLGKGLRRVCALSNGAVGVGLIATGALMKASWLAGLGVVAIGGAVLLAADRKK